MNDYRTKIIMLVVFGIFTIGSLIIWDNMISKKDEPEQRITSVEQVIEDSNDMFNEVSKAHVRHAVRQVISQFTMEDLLNHNYIVDLKEINKTNSYMFIESRLMDGNLIIIGYFDDNNIFHSTLKRKQQ